MHQKLRSTSRLYSECIVQASAYSRSQIIPASRCRIYTDDDRQLFWTAPAPDSATGQVRIAAASVPARRLLATVSALDRDEVGRRRRLLGLSQEMVELHGDDVKRRGRGVREAVPEFSPGTRALALAAAESLVWSMSRDVCLA